MSTRIFVDLPVRDLAAARACCRALGYRINPDFSNAAAACIVVGESIAVMRLAYPFFRTFTEAGAAP